MAQRSHPRGADGCIDIASKASPVGVPAHTESRGYHGDQTQWGPALFKIKDPAVPAGRKR